jgi:hypothetical protein
MKMHKFILTAALVVASASASLAGATLNLKDSNKSHQGSEVGQIQSHYTGNGAIIGGNGDLGNVGPNGNANRGNVYSGAPGCIGCGNGNSGASGLDQTNSPGSRADVVHSEQQSGDAPGNSEGSHR